MKRLIDFIYILTLAMSYVLVYDIARTRETNNCKDEVLIRDIQMKSMLAIERRMRSKGIKWEHNE